MTSPHDGPRVAVILPAYKSEGTVEACLDALAAQTFRDFETVLVDSDPAGRSAALARQRHAWVRVLAPAQRLLPHAARNLGVAHTRSELLVFSDPDIYTAPDWLARPVSAYGSGGRVVVGALDCHGSGWRERGMHLCKFAKWLPGGVARPVDMSPTGNMLVARADFERAGGLPGDLLLGDIELSRRLRALGLSLDFEPAAVGCHHHAYGLVAFMRERYERGVLFGELRASWWQRRRLRLTAALLWTLLPPRLLRILAIVATQAARAGWLGRLALTLPIVAAGHAAALLGEARGYWRAGWSR